MALDAHEQEAFDTNGEYKIFVVDALSPFLNREHIYNIETFSEAGFETYTIDNLPQLSKRLGRAFAQKSCREPPAKEPPAKKQPAKK